VFGILLGFAMMFPDQRLVLIFPPIPIKAKYFVLLYGAFELYAGVTGSMSGVAHFAHLGGMAFGLLMILYWRGQLPIKPARRLMR
jgi:membrane associated rhomboid family serine protease